MVADKLFIISIIEYNIREISDLKLKLGIKRNFARAYLSLIFGYYLRKEDDEYLIFVKKRFLDKIINR